MRGSSGVCGHGLREHARCRWGTGTASCSCFEFKVLGLPFAPLSHTAPQLIIRYVSEGSYALLRRTPESMIGTLSEDLVHGGDQVRAAGWGHVVECHCGVTGRFVGGVG